ncbi:GntR family transcriptional regulator [Arthrobacter sp. GMC3]|uniref:GntR family transcriptional regulator n=1 Tax=Arthrobacter sp. GMC3 TaxID=2058894 RepID=UPI000CE2D719|nr:GntR family transcriptional regulator [Arthrobacter sp. GMC3]
MQATKAMTRATQLHDTLRADILRGVLSPGTPLRLAALAEAYDGSMSVVREALGRLAEHNLAVWTPNQGYRVIEISRADVVNITELRTMLEADALRRSIESGDVRWEAEVISAHHVLERATLRDDSSPGSTQEWSEAHTAFHEALVSACGNPRLLALTRSLRDGAEIYRQLSGASVHGMDRDIAAEHRELMELATARKSAQAQAVLVHHLEQTTDDLLASGTLPS